MISWSCSPLQGLGGCWVGGWWWWWWWWWLCQPALWLSSPPISFPRATLWRPREYSSGWRGSSQQAAGQTSSNISQISKDFTLQQPASSEWLATDKQLIMSSFPTNILADVGALESGDDRPVISGVGDGPELSWQHHWTPGSGTPAASTQHSRSSPPARPPALPGLPWTRPGLSWLVVSWLADLRSGVRLLCERSRYCRAGRQLYRLEQHTAAILCSHCQL